jgi:hypothetical protein
VSVCAPWRASSVEALHDNANANVSLKLRQVTGRSILHELTDAELTALVAFIATQIPHDEPIVEKSVDAMAGYTGLNGRSQKGNLRSNKGQ